MRSTGTARGAAIFQNDALIALTARRHGATIVTSDGEDFELLGRALRIRVLTVVSDA